MAREEVRPSWTFKLEISTEATRIRPSGEIDMASADQFQQVITAHLVNGALRVVVDLGDVTFLDSSGSRALLVAHQFATEHQRSLKVENTPPMVRTVLEIGGVMNLLTGEPAMRLRRNRDHPGFEVLETGSRSAGQPDRSHRETKARRARGTPGFRRALEGKSARRTGQPAYRKHALTAADRRARTP